MSRPFPIAYALATLFFAPSAAFTQQHTESTPVQRWSISFSEDEDTAVIRPSIEIEVKFIQATVKTLQQVGVESFAIRAPDSTAPKVDGPSIAIQLNDGEAELTTSNELPHKIVIAVISALSENGVRKIHFAQAKPHSDAAIWHKAHASRK
jgi:biopolymer transport protein ExbD